MRLEGEGGDHIDQQDRGQPFQNCGDLLVAEADRGISDARSEDDDPDARVHSGQQVRGITHAGKIRANIDGVCGEKSRGGQDHKGLRELAPQGTGEAMPGDHPDASAHHLHSGHKRPRNEGRPEKACAKLRASDGVGGDTGRIIIRGTRYQTWAKRHKEAGDDVPRLFRCLHTAF